MKLIISGGNGRMGSALKEELKKPQNLDITLCHSIEAHNANTAKAAIEQADVVLDFTTPAAALEYARICTKLKKPIVIGSTGFNKTQQAELEDMAKRNTIFMSANMSWGVAVSNHLAKIAASMLSHEEFDCDILETHHRYKQDAPSGTALMLGHTIATARGIELQDALYSADQGRRPEGKIGFASLRSGGTIGHHEASFNSQSESIKITHIASDRSVFAAGALRVTRWVTYATPWPGRIYSMQDIMQTYRK